MSRMVLVFPNPPLEWESESAIEKVQRLYFGIESSNAILLDVA